MKGANQQRQRHCHPRPKLLYSRLRRAFAAGIAFFLFSPSLPSAHGQALEQQLQQRMEALDRAKQAEDTSAVMRESRTTAAILLQLLAKNQISGGHRKEGLELYRRALDLDDSPVMAIGVASGYIQAGAKQEALEVARRLQGTDPENADLLKTVAEIQLRAGDIQLAAANYAQSYKLHHDVDTGARWAGALLRLKKENEARGLIQRLVQDAGDSAELRMTFGKQFLRQGDYRGAIEQFKSALKMDALASGAHLWMAFAYSLLNEMQFSPEMQRELTTAQSQAPNDFYPNYFLGRLESDMQQYDNAATNLKRAAAADPSSPDPWLQLGINEFNQGDFTNAREHLKRSIELTGQHEERNGFQARFAYLALSRIAARENQLEESKRLYLQAMDLKHMLVAAQKGSATAQMGSGAMTQQQSAQPNLGEAAIMGLTAPGQEPNEASKQLESRDQELRKALAVVFNDWGTAAARSGDFKEASLRYRDARDFDPALPGLMRNLGLTSLQTGDVESAIRAFQSAYDQDPSDRTSLTYLAISLFRSQRYSQAAEAFRKMGEQIFQEPKLAYSWALAEGRSGNLQKATEILQRITTLALPPEAKVQIGNAFNELGDYAKALELFQSALAGNSQLQGAHLGVGIALRHMSKSKQAVSEFEQEATISPDNPDVQVELGLALLDSGNTSRGLSALRSAVAAHPEYPVAQFALGQKLLSLGKAAEAIAPLQAAARLEPGRIEVHQELVKALRKLGRDREASAELALIKKLQSGRLPQATKPD
jgi:tetratricopeptide (TPR) repeat protein